MSQWRNEPMSQTPPRSFAAAFLFAVRHFERSEKSQSRAETLRVASLEMTIRKINYGTATTMYSPSRFNSTDWPLTITFAMVGAYTRIVAPRVSWVVIATWSPAN